MLTFLSFLLIALLAILILVVIVGLLLIGKGIDLIRQLFGLKPRSRFRWNVNMHASDGRGHQQTTTRTSDGYTTTRNNDGYTTTRNNDGYTTTRTSDGVTIIDRRSPDETNKKIFAPDEGEYVEFTEK